MNVLIIAFGIILILLGSAFIYITLKDQTVGLFGTILILIGGICMFYRMNENSNPTAMDVYQGRTTLEITYKDGIAIDSVVVFKEKVK